MAGIDFNQLGAEILEATARRLKTEIVNEKVIPKDQGTLETAHHVSHPEQNRSEISASTPYARKLYMHPEYDFNQGDNIRAKGQWFEDWEPGGKYENRAAEIFIEEFKRRTGG
ncbi:MAG: hypothetical protein IJ642_01730 [Oscillospiraceae bacterium]|nr:hypothetical protein [Oscillospiraceae bacterium]